VNTGTAEKVSEQVGLETESIRLGARKYQHYAEQLGRDGFAAVLRPAQKLLGEWFAPLRKAIAAEQKLTLAGKYSTHRAEYGPPLVSLHADTIAVATLNACLGNLLTFPEGLPISGLAKKIGDAVLAEIHMDLLARNERESYRKMHQRFRALTPKLVNKWGRKTLKDSAFSTRVSTILGAKLLGMLIELTAGIYDNPPLVVYKHYLQGKRYIWVRLNDIIFDIVQRDLDKLLIARPVCLPMIVRPRQWTATQTGGYLRLKNPLISHSCTLQRKLVKAADISQVHAALNALNATAWRINRFIYDVVKQIWETGGGLALVPPRDNLPLPDPPPATSPRSDKARWHMQRKNIMQQNLILRGERTKFLNCMATADRMVGYDRFYMPHIIDFRGRIYPRPALLNTHANDLARGLLEFAHPAKPVNYQSIAIHLANCCGLKHLPHEHRLQWVKSNLHEFARWASNPMDNIGWASMPKPLEALAAARALIDDDAAMHLPIQLDGTCNGLQHYTALGLDEKAAPDVNMMPSSSPADLYAKVTAMTLRAVRQDIEAGYALAAVVEPFITRDVVKPIVMTMVYGLTAIGARQQVWDWLQKIEDNHQRFEASAYLSNVIRWQVSRMCDKAAAIMGWLRRCGNRIATAGHLVRWKNPIGLPVVQPYRQRAKQNIRTITGRLKIAIESDKLPIAIGKQKTALPPNLIHSIDSSHLMFTALACQAEGIAFAAVHDSYWTHSATANALQDILRQKFVELHQRNILMDIYYQFRHNYPTVDIPMPPLQGDYDLQQVLQSRYFFN